jgi:hypothetical protein
LSVDTSRPSNSTFVLGESVGLSFKATGLTAGIVTTLTIRVTDEFGAEMATADLPLTADSSGNATGVYSPPASKYGFYRVSASLLDGTAPSRLGTRPAGFITYAVLQDPATRQNYGDSGSRFGMQGGFSYAQGNLMRYLGVRYLLDEPGWRSLEPDHAGEFAEARSAATAKGQSYPGSQANNAGAWPTYSVALLSTGSIPTWAMESGTGTTGSPNMGVLNSAGIEGLPEFATARANAFAADFQGQSARYYQVTWEPEMPVLFSGTTQQLLQYFQLSYQAIHQADPKAIVMGPTMFPGDETPMSRLWAAGLANYVDAISMHPYANFPAEANNLVSNIRSQMQMAQSAKGHSVTFVGTEHGLTSGSIGELNQALGNVRSTIIVLGEGFKFDVAFYIADFWVQDSSETANTYGYYWNLDPNIKFGTDKVGPKPAVPAFAAMSYWLDGTTTMGPVANLTGSQMGYRFERDGTNVLALWDYRGPSTVSLPVSAQGAQVCDWMSNCTAANVVNGTLNLRLGTAPVYVIGAGL